MIAPTVVVPYGMSLANRIWPGGTRPNSVRWSVVLHHDVSK
jgi:hypothetical protein